MLMFPGRVRGTGNRMMGVKLLNGNLELGILVHNTGPLSLFRLPAHPRRLTPNQVTHTTYFMAREGGWWTAGVAETLRSLLSEKRGFDVKFIPPLPCPCLN